MTDVFEPKSSSPYPTVLLSFMRSGMGVILLRLKGEVDIAAAPFVADAFRRASLEEPTVVDIRGLSFLDVAGLRAISTSIDPGSNPRPKVCWVALAGSTPERLLELIGASFDVVWTAEEALAVELVTTSGDGRAA